MSWEECQRHLVLEVQWGAKTWIWCDYNVYFDTFFINSDWNPIEWIEREKKNEQQIKIRLWSIHSNNSNRIMIQP